MCGIFGIIARDPAHFDYAQAQLRSIVHRGPDEEGSWRADGVFLGSRRLSIIDLAGGKQPIFNEDRSCCIVYNGELYNFLDLRPQLEAKGHVFTTRTDTEVVLHAYEEWGLECFRHFNGMFAFAIWDARNRRMIIARDRIGEKPLYYFSGKGRFVFASEIKAIVADPTIPRRVSPSGLVNYLTYGHALFPETMYEGIFKIPPGHFAIVEDQDPRVIQYWDVGDEPQEPDRTGVGEDEYAARILDLLDDSVRRRMVADVPVGAFLSGGVDSSAVVALMKRHATGPVKTFSLGFTIGGAYNELPDARRVAYFLGTEHHELLVDHADMVGTLQKLVYHYDEPYGDAANFPLYLISEFARQHVKVVLAGDGGDELFGGYRRFVADQMAPFYQVLPEFLSRRLIPGAAGRIPRFRRLKRILSTLPVTDPAARTAEWLQVFTQSMREELLMPAVRGAAGGHDPTWQYSLFYNRQRLDRPPLDHLNRLMYVDLKTWLADAYMEKVDKATMAASLEGRLPILDHRLVELAFQIPGRFKIKGRSTKQIFKKAVSSLLPADVLRKPKHGFAVPTDPWFRGSLKSFVFDTLMDDRTRSRGYFNSAYIERLYRFHSGGKEVHDTALWLLLNFELWHRTYLDSPQTGMPEAPTHA
jgi:asparagine synthase (glutamine-hydrolysing)